MKPNDERLQFIVRDAIQGFTDFCGMIPVAIEPGRFVTRIPIKPHHLQQDGLVHAGVIAMMADHTAGYASFTLVPPDRRILTIEYKINFLKPAAGEFLECRGRVIKPGRQILVAESDVYAIEGKDENLVAKALLTMAAVPQEKVKKSVRRIKD